MSRFLHLRSGFRWGASIQAIALVSFVFFAGVAQGQDACPGDCNSSDDVDISEAVLATDIALGLDDIDECPAVDVNGSGDAEVDDLVQVVGSLINGCPSPSETETPTLTPTDGPTETPTVTPTAELPVSCQLAPSSTLTLIAAALTIPLEATGAIDVTVDEQGQARCDIIEFDPLEITAVGFVCITPPEESCPAGMAFCPASGEAGIGIDLVSDRIIGTCTGNADCIAQCDTYCAGIGKVPTDGGFGCEGFCDGGDLDGQACTLDEQCTGGSCNGNENVPFGNVCECQCIDTNVGDPPSDGDFTCSLGSSIIVEVGPPCGDGDALIVVGTRCIPLTSKSSQSIIDSANGNVCSNGGSCVTDADCDEGATCNNRTLPAGGPDTATGNALECSAVASGSFTGLGLRGHVNFFGSALGDLVTRVSVDCL